MRWAGAVAHVGEMRNEYRILVRKQEGKRPLRRPGCRWEVNTRMGIREIRWKGVDWILAHGRDHWQALVNMV
jgi:hypothetical protein